MVSCADSQVRIIEGVNVIGKYKGESCFPYVNDVSSLFNLLATLLGSLIVCNFSEICFLSNLRKLRLTKFVLLLMNCLGS